MVVNKEVYQMIQGQMKKRRGVKVFTKKDVTAILKAQETGDWSEVHKSKLYVKHGGDYCSMLEVLNNLKLLKTS